MKKKTKQKIIDSAIDLFSKDSYGKVSIAQICKNAKILSVLACSKTALSFKDDTSWLYISIFRKSIIYNRSK